MITQSLLWQSELEHENHNYAYALCKTNAPNAYLNSQITDSATLALGGLASVMCECVWFGRVCWVNVTCFSQCVCVCRKTHARSITRSIPRKFAIRSSFINGRNGAYLNSRAFQYSWGRYAVSTRAQRALIRAKCCVYPRTSPHTHIFAYMHIKYAKHSSKLVHSRLISHRASFDARVAGDRMRHHRIYVSISNKIRYLVGRNVGYIGVIYWLVLEFIHSKK